MKYFYRFEALMSLQHIMSINDKDTNKNIRNKKQDSFLKIFFEDS